MKESSPVTEGLLTIHKVISRSLKIAVRKCDEYNQNQGVPDGEVKGFTLYLTVLKQVTHAHHMGEDELVFPYFRNKIGAPYERLKEDHDAISRTLNELERALPGISSGGLVRISTVLNEFYKLWVPHIRVEEEYFTSEKIGEVSGIEEQKKIVQEVGEHSYKNSGPSPLVLPFVFFNLERIERNAIMSEVPWFVRKILMPIIWKSQWKSMRPFLQYNNGIEIN